MRKLILEEWISLDGYAEDINGQLDFFTQLTPEQNKYSDKDQLTFLEAVDTILIGRKTYDLFVKFWPDTDTSQEVIADAINQTRKFVFSNTLIKAPWGSWPEAEVISGDAVAEIKKLKQQPGKHMVMWGSISLAQALIREDLIDEFHLQLCPVLTGGGRKLFPHQEKLRQLNLLEVKQYTTGTILLQYEPKRS